MPIPVETIIQRLAALHGQIERAIADLPQAALDWVPGSEMNSLAVLVIHTTGVERYYFGELAGGRPAHRDRPAEFATHGQDEAALKAALAEALADVTEIMASLSDEDLSVRRVWPATGEEVSGAMALVLGLTHVAEHVGHMQITRDLILNEVAGSGFGSRAT